MSSFDTFINSFDPDSLTRGKQFERFVKWFLKNDPEWLTQIDKVWLWDEYPDRWGPDCGIDLVFSHKNGEIWAVQAKCYDTKYSITKKDVDTFLSESNRKGIDKRLLIASTDQVGKKARQVCKAQEKQVNFFLYSNFDKAAIDYPSSLSELNNAKRKDPPTPRPHQKQAIKDVKKGFKIANRGQMIMACGTGKTYVTLWVKETLNANTTLVLLPSLSLLSQTLWEWTFASNTPFEALCVCSDETVSKKQNTDAIVSSIQDVSFPTTSDPEVIKKFLKRDVNKVVFCTYHSSPRIAEAQAHSNAPIFDLVIADEAHRCTGETGKAFTTVLDDSLIKANKRLFTTATPRVYSANHKKRHSEIGVDIADMSDELFFGKEFHNLTFAQAIDKDLLTDYRIVIVGVDEPMIAQWIDRRQLVRTNKNDAIDAKTLASQVGLIKAIKDYDLKRMISFHSRVKKAELFASELHDAIEVVSDEHRPKGELYTDYVSGIMPSVKRTLKLSKLKTLHDSDRGLLTNARCLSEGIDVPSLDGVAFIDPQRSQVGIIQAVGRAIRKSEDKTFGTIVLPVFIEDKDDAAESIQTSNFKPIWDVLNALKSHDETLSLELGQIRTNLGRQLSSGSASISIPEKIIFDLPTRIDNSFADSLKTILVEKTTSSWDFWYGVLENFVELNGHTLVPNKYLTENGLRLGQWVNVQRTNQNILSSERASRLELLKSWTWSVLDFKWNEGFNYLKEYFEVNGHTRMGQDFITSDNFLLGSWTQTQRDNYRNNTLSEARYKKLESIPKWTWNPLEDDWNKGFDYLKEYVQNSPDSSIKFAYKKTYGNFNLGVWIHIQKRSYNSGTLSSEKKELLESITGWIWKTKEENAWDVGFNYLLKFIELKGHPRVSSNFKIDGYLIGRWVSRHRKAYQLGKLSKERIKQLESVPQWTWHPLEDDWNKGLSALQEFVKIKGHSKVFQKYINDEKYKLGKWVHRHREGYKLGRLSKERVKQLESLKGWSWNPLEDDWNEGFDYLKKYTEFYGTARVRKSFNTDNGYPLGKWVSTQRSRKKQNKVSNERKQKLESLPGWVWIAN